MNSLAARLLLAFVFILALNAILTVAVASRTAAVEIRHAMHDSALMPGVMHGDAADMSHVMEVPAEVVVGRVNRAVGLASLLASVVALALAFLLVRIVNRPLAQTVATTRLLASGNRDARAPEEGPQEVQEVARAVNQLADELAAQEARRRALLADVAHELRTPLTIMQGQIEAMQDGVFPLTLDELDPLHSQVRQLSRLVEDLRTLAHAEAGELPLERAPVEPKQLVGDILSAFGPGASDAGITLSSDLPDGLPSLDADGVRLRQVLDNLLSNALRHTPPGGKVHLSAADEGDSLLISVSDSGEGIPAEAIPHLFDRFYRVDASRSRASGGSGLGLAIARRLTEAHGGTIAVTSENRQGTTATLRWPTVLGAETDRART